MRMSRRPTTASRATSMSTDALVGNGRDRRHRDPLSGVDVREAVEVVARDREEGRVALAERARSHLQHLDRAAADREDVLERDRAVSALKLNRAGSGARVSADLDRRHELLRAARLEARHAHPRSEADVGDGVEVLAFDPHLGRLPALCRAGHDRAEVEGAADHLEGRVERGGVARGVRDDVAEAGERLAPYRDLEGSTRRRGRSPPRGCDARAEVERLDRVEVRTCHRDRQRLAACGKRRVEREQLDAAGHDLKRPDL